MANGNRIPHGDPELRDVPMGFPDSVSSLCDMMNATMAAVLNEIAPTQADEACGTEHGVRAESRVNSCNGYGRRSLETTGTLDLGVPRLRGGSCFPTELFGRWPRRSPGRARPARRCAE